MLTSILLAQSAQAAPPVPTYPAGAHHIWKVQAWYMLPLYRSSGTWRQHRAMAWGAVLDCVVTGERQERCTFADDEAYWGFIPKDSNESSLYAIDMHAQLDLTWNAQGHVAKWDWVGDLTAFDDGVCAALGKMHWSGNGVIRSADDRRRVGQEMAEDLVHAVLGGLDIELPKQVTDSEWVMHDLPMATRRFPTTAGQSKIQARYAPRDEYSPNVSFEGSATVAPLAGGGGTSEYQEMVDVRGAAQVNAEGRIAHGHVAVAVRQFGRSGDYELTDYRADLLDAVPPTAAERAPGPCPSMPN